ncbi:hypothetical protein FE810_13860 [Thalassotalea litorea]|uniref:Ysc84 actin-binding domain-containing protein n=1 Tax=Thalassotalea litorea TaxID=2020715 RepID=A0A5R9INM7_9GAMM|nr:YSC84-related protein [Thalassotalea litorea]TLU61599.1 hypothetical protein FE810_13860 [Thalassotalea litorea]
MVSLKTASIVFLCVLLSACASMGDGSTQDKQDKILSMKNDVLTQLFQQKPDSRKVVEGSKGYGVFSNANVNLLVVSAGTGYGVVKNMATQQHTYMNMAEGGVGLGMGVKDYRIVMVFHTKQAMDHFVNNGWTFGGNADAAAVASKKGGSIEGEAYFGDVTVYTFTEAGLALQATVKGTKFWVDSELNP